MLAFTVVLVPAAKILPKLGPAKTCLLGAVFLVSGLVISSFAGLITYVIFLDMECWLAGVRV